MRNNPTVALRGDRNECPSCGILFNSSGAFDKHRIGTPGVDRRCRTREEMLAVGMKPNAAGFWVRKPMTDASKQHHRAARIDDQAGSGI